MENLIDITKEYEEKLVYIDFESVSVPLAYDAGLGGEYPYAFSVGIYGDKDIYTYIFEGKNIRNNILRMKQSLMKFLKINSENQLKGFRFVGWNGGLERQVLNRMFETEYKYVDLMLSNREFSAALDDIAAKGNELDLGFEYTRSIVNQDVKDIFINRKRGKLGDFEPLTGYKSLRSGAIACLIGAIKYGSMTSRGKRTISQKMKLYNFDVQSMTDELREYSKKDVEDMIQISNNFKLSERRYSFMKEKHLERLAYKKEFFDFNGSLKKIKNDFKDGLTSTELFDNYVIKHEKSYIRRACKKLEYVYGEVEINEKISNLADKYKAYDIEDFSKLKDYLIKENYWTEDFMKMSTTYDDMLSEFKVTKESIKQKAKTEVKNIM